jgi:hypothetical protein
MSTCALGARFVGLRLPACAGSLAVLLAGSAWTQQPPATVVTKKGETIEGSFKGGTESDITIMIGGQTVKLPLLDVKYISFAGRLGATETTAKKAPEASQDDAFAAFEELQASLEIGVLRPQYAEKLQQTLPRVLRFLKTLDRSWYPDAQTAMMSAVEEYQQALGMWELARLLFEHAKKNVAYARQIIATDEPGHREDPGEKTLTPGANVHGRLGLGDLVVLSYLEQKVPANAFADVYVVTAPTAQTLGITVAGSPCTPAIRHADAAGRRLEKEGAGGRWSVKLLPGPNHLLVLCAGGGVGTYELSTQVQP